MKSTDPQNRWRLRVASRWLLLRQTGLTQTGEDGGFELGIRFRRPVTQIGPQFGNARYVAWTIQPADFHELAVGTLGFALETIGRGEKEVHGGNAGAVLRAFESQMIASSIRDSSRYNSPSRTVR